MQCQHTYALDPALNRIMGRRGPFIYFTMSDSQWAIVAGRTRSAKRSILRPNVESDKCLRRVGSAMGHANATTVHFCASHGPIKIRTTHVQLMLRSSHTSRILGVRTSSV